MPNKIDLAKNNHGQWNSRGLLPRGGYGCICNLISLHISGNANIHYLFSHTASGGREEFVLRQGNQKLGKST